MWKQYGSGEDIPPMGPDSDFNDETNRLLNTSIEGPLKENLHHAVETSSTLGSLLKKIGDVLLAWAPLVEPPIFLITGGPCLLSLLFSKILCAPLWLVQAGVKGFKNMLVGGSDYNDGDDDLSDQASNKKIIHRTEDFNKIYDPISRNWYDIGSKRGQATLMGMVGQMHLNIIHNHKKSVDNMEYQLYSLNKF